MAEIAPGLDDGIGGIRDDEVLCRAPLHRPCEAMVRPEAEILAVVRDEDTVIEGPGDLEGEGGLTGGIAGIENRDCPCGAG